MSSCRVAVILRRREQKPCDVEEPHAEENDLLELDVRRASSAATATIAGHRDRRGYARGPNER
jgi:hypothetical protein